MTTPLIDDDTAADEILGALADPVALDTEFHSEHRFHPRLMLVQVRGEGGPAHVLDARSVDPRRIAAALSHRPLIAHAPAQDLAILRRYGLEPGHVTDTQVLAGFAGLGYPRSLGDLCRDVLDRPMPGGSTLSDWARRPLATSQLAYAREDVLHLHELVAALGERIPDRFSDAVTACTAEVLTPARPEDAWQRIRAFRVLSPSDRATLVRLATWRERTARALDQPSYQMANDASLIDLARRRPNSIEQMRANRRFPKRLAKQHGAALLPLLAGPSGDRWPYEEHAKEAAATAALESFAARFEVEEGIAARLTLPPTAIRAVIQAIRAGSPPQLPLAQWRKDRLEVELSRFVTETALSELLTFSEK
ncbi:MAG: hypothetical protein GY913_31340 [Proteobacteria bacterium]|nr:hypothetical protein [Pseudomonadota bacterium]MCP4921414.1 hypothetical protein [Pseudomonadota bacterium]